MLQLIDHLKIDAGQLVGFGVSTYSPDATATATATAWRPPPPGDRHRLATATATATAPPAPAHYLDTSTALPPSTPARTMACSCNTSKKENHALRVYT